jgi:glutathione S-transferase
MIELYHFGFSTCSQKVRLVLAEKGLEFESHEVNLMAGEQNDPAYVELNPNHVVPTLVHDGEVLIESSLIIKYLDDAFPEPPMRPQNALGRYAVDRWLMHADEALHPAAPTVTFAIGPRKLIIQQPAAVREANIAGIQDPIQRATRRSVIEHGVAAPESQRTRRCCPTCCGSSTSPWIGCSSAPPGPASPIGWRG